MNERAEIEAILEELRPAIQGDGGDVELVSFVDGVVALKLHGACATCALSIYTLKMGIEERLRERIPTIQSVIRVE